MSNILSGHENLPQGKNSNSSIDADKAAEENADMTVEEFYSGFDLSWMTEEEIQTIYTATELYAKGKLRQSGKERAALEKYGRHLPTCNINQDWSEAYDAMANTPNELRGEDYWEALLEMDEKRKKCTCGFEQALSGKQEDQDELWDEVENIYDKHTMPTGGGYEADYTDKNSFISELKSKYTLTRK